MSSQEEEHSARGIFVSILPIQWLAAAAGCVTAVALLGLSWIASLASTSLIVAALSLSRFPRRGPWFIFVPALALSTLVLPISVVNAIPLSQALFFGPHDFNFVTITVSWLLSPILLVWCITAAATSIVKPRRTSL